VSLVFADLCRKKSVWVGFEFRVDSVREVNSMALRELIDSGFKNGCKFSFILCALFDGSAFLRKFPCFGRP
jgi:hypothetical protein